MVTSLRIFILVLLSSAAFGQVWFHDDKRTWDEATESRYSQWIADRVNTDFVSQEGNFYSRLAVDCADFQYLLRIVFARTHGLEFAINDPTKPGNTISSRSTRWQNIRDLNERARRFFMYVKDITSTQTLVNDTVLVALNRESLRPGVILLSDRARGHSMVVKSFRPSGIPILLFGSLPPIEFIYKSFHFPDPLSYFPMGPITHARGGGLRRFKWPIDILKSPTQISYASADQLQAGRQLETFFESVQKAIRVHPVTPDESLNYLVDDLCSQMRIRVNTITDAVNFLGKNQGRRLSAIEEDRFSTTKRDENIRGLISKVKSSFRMETLFLSSATKKRLGNIMSPVGDTNDECIVDWAEHAQEPLGWIIQRFEKPGLVSSRATDSLTARWGIY